MELVVVVALLAIVSGLAASNLSSLIGRYRMNAAAREFSKLVEVCRVQAISENRQIAIQLRESDPTPLDGNTRDNKGHWTVEAGDHHATSTQWAVVEDGFYSLDFGPHARRGISLEPWQPLNGPVGYSKPDALVFSPQGYLINDPADFVDGIVRIVFRNKAAPAPEARVVRINTGGMAQIAAVD